MKIQISESELVGLVREEVRDLVSEFGPQHDFRSDPGHRSEEFMDYLNDELGGVVDAHVSKDPIDRSSGRYTAVIEISEKDMERSRLSWRELQRRVESIARGGDEIVQDVFGVDAFEADRRHEFYGFEIPFLA